MIQNSDAKWTYQGVTETSKVVDVLFHMLEGICFVYITHFANAVIYCSQLNTYGVLGLIRHKWIISH
jgi:hypothetical protein